MKVENRGFKLLFLPFYAENIFYAGRLHRMHLTLQYKRIIMYNLNM